MERRTKAELLDELADLRTRLHAAETRARSLDGDLERARDSIMRAAAAQDELGLIRLQHEQLRRDAKILVHHLIDAWWVQAAEALLRIRDSLE